MLVEDLPAGEIAAIAGRHGLHWFDLAVASPAEQPDAFFQLVCLVAQKCGEPAPDWDGKLGSFRRLLAAHLEKVPDDLPSEWVDGNPQGGGPTT